MSFIQQKQDLQDYTKAMGALSGIYECTDGVLLIITGILERSRKIIAEKTIQHFFDIFDHSDPLKEYYNIIKILQDEQERLDIINYMTRQNPESYLLPNEQRELIAQARDKMSNLQLRIEDIQPIEYKLQVLLELHKTNQIYPMHVIDDVLINVIACEKAELDLSDILSNDNAECDNDLFRYFNKANDYVLHQNTDSNYDALLLIGSTEEDWVLL